MGRAARRRAVVVARPFAGPRRAAARASRRPRGCRSCSAPRSWCSSAAAARSSGARSPRQSAGCCPSPPCSATRGSRPDPCSTPATTTSTSSRPTATRPSATTRTGRSRTSATCPRTSRSCSARCRSSCPTSSPTRWASTRRPSCASEPGATRGLFDPDCPIALPVDIGTSVLLSAPGLLLALFAIRRRPVARLTLGAGLTVLVIVVFNLAHFSQGWVQWGYRFSLDFIPFLLPLVALGAGRVGDGRPRATAIVLLVAGAADQPVGRRLGPAAWLVAACAGPTRRRVVAGATFLIALRRLPRDDAAGHRRVGHGRGPDRAAAARDDAPDRVPGVRPPRLAREPRPRAVRRAGVPDDAVERPPRRARRRRWPCSCSAASARRRCSRARRRSASRSRRSPGTSACPRTSTRSTSRCSSRSPSGCSAGRRRSGTPGRRPTDEALARRADRRIVGTAALFGVSVANHGLTLLLVPAVALFVLAVDRGVLRRPRLVLAALGTAVGVAALLYLELPLRAGPFRAPLVYGHPETLQGLLDDRLRAPVLGRPGRRRPRGQASSAFSDLAADQLGPLALLAVPGVRRHRDPPPALRAVLGARGAPHLPVRAPCTTNARIDRYYLGPVFFAWSWLVAAAAAIVELAGRAGSGPGDRVAHRSPGVDSTRTAVAIALGIVLLVPTAIGLRDRWNRQDLSQSTAAPEWLDEALAALDRGRRRGVVVELLDAAVVRDADRGPPPRHHDHRRPDPPRRGPGRGRGRDRGEPRQPARVPHPARPTRRSQDLARPVPDRARRAYPVTCSA